MNEFELAKQKGVVAEFAKGFMPYKMQGGRMVVDYDLAAKRLAMDAAQTVPNIGVPSAYFTYLDPNVTEILFAVQNATKIFAESKKGDWTDKYMQFPISEFAGAVTPYSDYAENVTSDVNYEYPSRENFIFQTTLQYGDLEQANATRAKLALASDKQKGAAFVINNAHNKFYLYGVAGKRVYGLLNDPNLPTSETPISIGSNSTWAAKTAADPDASANIIFNDINKLWSSLTAKNGGNIDANSPIILAISNKMTPYLTQPNQYGKTARTLLTENYPNIQIVELPELSTQAGEMLFMTVPQVFGEPTAECAFSEKMRMGRIIPELSSYKQKVIGGTWGCVVRRPFLIATMVGIQLI